MNSKRFSKTSLAVFGILALIGIGCWIYQLANGLAVTGMSNSTSWGLYITCFMFFEGLSAGGLIVASSAHVFNIKSFKKVALPAVITSTVSICLAGAFVLIDLGSIQWVLQMFATPNFLSPLVWHMAVIMIYLVLNILDIVFITKGKEQAVRGLSCVALPVAILVPSVTAWIFSLQIGRMWHTAIMAPVFVASALDSGLSLLIITLVLLEAKGMVSVSSDLFSNLAKLLATFVAVDACLIGCEVLTMAYPGATDSIALGIMATGATAPFFWLEIIFGLAVPFIILVASHNRKGKAPLMCASILIILGVFCKRVWLLITAFVAPFAEDPTAMVELAGDATSFGAMGSFYTPSLIEAGIVIGAISLGIFLFLLLANALLGRKPASASTSPAVVVSADGVA